MKKGKYREAYEEIYNNLRLVLINADRMCKDPEARKEFPEFDLRRLRGCIENALEVYGEVLGYITYED